VPFFQAQLHLSSAHLGLPIALGVLLAGVGQMILLQQQLRRQRISLPLFQFSLSAEARKMWFSFFPAALGAGVIQINLFVDLVLASLLATGSISWLYYADRLAQLPLGLVGIAMGTALLPRLSRIEAGQHITKQAKQQMFSAELSNAAVLVSILTIPAVAALLVLSDILIIGLFRSGAFQATDAEASALALMAYAVGLPSFVGLKLTQAALYAMDRGRFVLLSSCISVGLNIILSLGLMQIYQHVGLALATSLVSWLTLVWQVGWLARAGRFNSSSVTIILKAVVAAAVMAACLYSVLPWLYAALPSDFIIMVSSVILGLSFYLVVGHALGMTKVLLASFKEQRA
jgi:putative peptidoglycan lipid II flippase